MMFSTVLRPAAWLLGGMHALTLTAAAQTTVLDEGSFRISVNGAEVGTETFSIRQNGTGAGAVIVAEGRITMDGGRGGEESRSRLSSTASLKPSDYLLRVEGGEPQTVQGSLRGNRFTAQISSPAGERMREYAAAEGAVLVDEGFAHHYYFLARQMGGSPVQVPLIIPRESRQVAAQVTPRGTDRIQIEGRMLEARLFTVQPLGGTERQVWSDERGRILRVEITARGFVAQRTAVPR
jgi:hypothetical protein